MQFADVPFNYARAGHGSAWRTLGHASDIETISASFERDARVSNPRLITPFDRESDDSAQNRFTFVRYPGQNVNPFRVGRGECTSGKNF